MYYIYVIDRDGKLEGVLTLRQLLVDSVRSLGGDVNGNSDYHIVG